MLDLRSIGSLITDFKKSENGVVKKYKIIDVYPFIIRCQDENGFSECFNIGDLIVLGLITVNNPRYGAASRYKWEVRQ